MNFRFAYNHKRHCEEAVRPTRQSLDCFAALAMTLFLLIAAQPAHAQCAFPPGSAGDMMYNDDRNVMQYCDNTNWIAMGGTVTGSTVTAPSADMIHHWTLDENTGTTAADSVGSDDGTFAGSPSWIIGVDGSGLYFDGSSQEVDMGDIADIRGISAITLAAWMRRDASNNLVLVGKQSSGGGDTIALELWNDGFLYCGLGDNTSYAGGSIALSDTLWHHIVMVFDGSQTGNANRLRCYVDGVNQTLSFTGTVPATTATDTGANFRLGRIDGAYSKGSIDDVRIYNRAISAQEVSDLYEATNQLANKLVGHWMLDETSGTTANDSSDYGHDGTMVGGLDAASNSVSGQIGTALDFDGTDDAIEYGSNYNFELREVTVSLWINADTLSGTQALMAHAPDGGGWCWTNTYNMVLVNNVVRFYTSGGAFHDATSDPLSTGQWYHLTGTLSDANDRIKIYIDGELVYEDEEDGTLYPGGGKELFLGRDGCGGYFDGKIDDARLYNYVLSDGEIADIYLGNQPAGPGGDSCSNPTGSAGDLMYNDSTGQMQYCNGAGWVAMGPPSGGTLTDGLAGHWKFDETSGTTALDSSGNGNNGTLTDGASFTSGYIGNGIVFDGSNDSVDIPNESFFDYQYDDPFSISAWFYRETNTTEDDIVEKWSNAGAGLGYFLYFPAGTNNLTFGLAEGANGYVESVAGITTGTWYHVVGTYDGSNTSGLKIYVNGIEQSTTIEANSAPSTILNNSQLTIGADQPGSSCCGFDGIIDEVRIYNRELSADEAEALYNYTGCQNPSGPSGSMLYNSTHDVMQYCNGANWVPIGKVP